MTARFHWPLLSLAVVVVLIGFVMVLSASMALGYETYADPFYFGYRHALYIGLAVVAFLVAISLPMDWLYSTRWLTVAGACAALVVVLVPGLGHTSNGATRWIALGGFTLQPAEFAKVAIVVFLAAHLTKYQQKIIDSPLHLAVALLVPGLLCALVLVEPDYGSTAILATVSVGLVFLAGVRLRWAAALAVLLVVAFVLLSVSQPYRLERLLVFQNPWAHPSEGGYQLIQALVAFGRGDWFGLGLGGSIQKLFYLPAAHNDFLFAVVVEETGVVGGLVITGLLTAIVFVCFRIGFSASINERMFPALLAYGAALTIGLQFVINVGVNTALLPTKGLTLPFVSYGGNSLIACAILLALVVRVDHETRADRSA